MAWRTGSGVLAGAVAAALLALQASAAMAQDTPTGGVGGTAEDPLKVGFVYVGPIGDFGYSYQHDQGRLALEAALGDAVETTYVENVPEGADAERVISQLADAGNDLIFTTSFGFMNATVQAAEQHPDVKFEHATGYKRAENLATYAARFYEGRYVVGTIVGHMTKSNVIGYIGSFPIPEVVQGIDAFTIALRKVNPQAEVRVVWIHSWYDPGKEADAARTLIDQGADVILQHTDSPAPVQVAEERGVWAVGQSSDMTEFGPKAHLTAIVDIWDDYYIERAQAVIDGTWTSQDTWGGFAENMLVLAPYNPAIPPEIVAEAEAVRAQIESGELNIFQGPIANQAGEIVVPEGEALTDEQLLSLNWLVQGVQGSLPQ